MTPTSLPAPAPAPPPGQVPVNYEHTPNLATVLHQLNLSLLVSTYQAGKVLAVGTHQGALTLAFSNFEQAMGMAPGPGQLAVGARRQVWFLRSAPDVAARALPAGRHDACYLTRSSHFTGAIHVHEMAWGQPPQGGGEPALWLVNTLFSCLCTLDDVSSFVPRWKPPFISALAAEDRCHLNGLAMANGRPRFVTCMAESDTAGGWRPTKATSGCILEVPSGAVVARGLAMPHSPRLHDGQLWVLDSGHGRLSRVDPAAGRAIPVTRLPGYTRGLALQWPYAFVGLSKIRETSVFGGIPIAERRNELRCGVVVIDTRDGQVLAGLYFNSGVDEIFDVKVLPGVRCPLLSGPLPDADGTPTIWHVPPLPAEPPGQA